MKGGKLGGIETGSAVWAAQIWTESWATYSAL